MNPVASIDAKFLGTLETWFHAQKEILLLIRYSHAGGNKSFEFFTSYDFLLKRIQGLPPLTSLIAFKQAQLPFRAVVDDEFIKFCMNSIPDGREFLLTETVLKVYGKMSWFHYASGESHAELHEALETSRGASVAVGLYPPWLKDTEDVTSTFVPDKNGIVRSGTY